MELRILDLIKGDKDNEALTLLKDNMNVLYYNEKWTIFREAFMYDCKSIVNYFLHNDKFIYNEFTFNRAFCYIVAYTKIADPYKFVMSKHFNPTTVVVPQRGKYHTWFMALADMNEHRALELCIASEIPLDTLEITEEEHAQKALATASYISPSCDAKDTVILLKRFLKDPNVTRKELRKIWFPREDAARVFILVLSLEENLLKLRK